MPLSSKGRPRAFEEDRYPWHLGKAPSSIVVKDTQRSHPAWTSAIFVVHGMGTQLITETAAALRSGFEDALDNIIAWQKQNSITSPLAKLGEVPPPLIAEGYWANYDDLKATFPNDWRELKGNKRSFFEALWRTRSHSPVRTFWWFIGEQLRLLHPRVIWQIHLFAWLLYIPLQIVSIALLLALLIRYPKILSDVLADVRLYVAPKGITERAIIQRIDYRVGSEFLKLIGLDWNFCPLPSSRQKKIQKKSVTFDRVIWVAHSLGTVISYNVLSDLFHRSAQLAQTGDKKQKEGVQRFRNALRRFVTLGSPLDKIAYLFGEETLRPWPQVARQTLIKGGETIANKGGQGRQEWWINFYHVLDPVSGALSHPLICGGQAPMNLHIGLFRFPGLAHIAYWNDSLTLRFILSRVYGKMFLEDREYKPHSAAVLTLLAVFGYLIWAALILAILYVLVTIVPSQIASWWTGHIL